MTPIIIPLSPPPSVMKESLYIVSLHTNAFSVNSNVPSDIALKQLNWLNEILEEVQN